MKLVLLGTGGYYPSPRRHTACLMLPEIGVVLDAGTGMFRLRDRLATDRLQIFLSHVHLDHVVGLTYLLDVLTPDLQKNCRVFAEAEKLSAIREHLFTESIFPVLPPFTLQPLGDKHALAGGGTLTHFPLKHPGGVRGFRLEWPGHSMAYVTDTTAAVDAAYVDKIRGVDLLVHEAYFADDEGDLPAITGHSCLMKVAQVAAAANVGRLLLVHISPRLERDDDFDLEPARLIFKNVELGTDEMEVEF
jgi:ribonuclease BN (tRNA processing enzyme)